jgi:hypothetical protein
MLGFLLWETLRERGSTQPTLKRFVRQSGRNDLGSAATWQMDGAKVIAASLTSISSADSSWKMA